MKNSLRNMLQLSIALGLIGGIGEWSAARASTAFDAPGNFNPVIPGYFADPTVKKFGDTFYIYATTDGNGGGRGPATVWVSKDFVNWVMVPMNWPGTPHYWAPDVVGRPDGKFYLYYNQPCNTFAGVSDTPIGPWKPLKGEDGLVVPDRIVKDVITLDTQIFEDKDGTLYGYWGTWGIFPNSGCGIGVLNPDMKSFARFSMIPNTQAKDFFEAPFMIERNGVYYFTYSSGSCHDASYRVQYAVGSKPDGEFKMGPNNPILATSADGTVHGPGHHSLLQQGDEYYMIYHRHDLPFTPNGMHRQTCADRMIFDGDGVIKKVEASHKGVGYLGPKSSLKNLVFTQPVTASSFYKDTLRKHEYKPAYAVDDNNATLWRPADNRMGHWLQVDLGSKQKIRRTDIQFEYGTWYYQYLVESSVDGKSWTTFADRRDNTRWGSPMVDTGDVEAQYLRLTVTGVELPGLFGAVWNFKAYSEAPEDPFLAMADKAFGEYIQPRQKVSNEQQTTQKTPGAGGAALEPINPEKALLIHVDASDLQLGQALAELRNKGSLGGVFTAGEAKPMVGMAGGCKSIRFAGKQILTASFRAPRALAGNSSFTVAAWVNDPEVGESECLVSWAGRGGPDATTAQVGYGTHREFGAVGHWGFADMGYRGAPPPAGEWQHIAVVFDGVVERVYVNGQQNNAEAKMLLMHQGRPVYLGASEPGSEYFDGYLASLRVYGAALSESQVKELAAEKPAADVLVHVDSARLEYGSLSGWTNSGSAAGVFGAKEKAPVVANVKDRIATVFTPGGGVELALSSPATLKDFTLLLSVAAEDDAAGAVQLEDSQGKRHSLIPKLKSEGWQQLAIVRRGSESSFYQNGKRLNETVKVSAGDMSRLHLGGSEKFSGAIARAQLFSRALSDSELSELHTVWKNEARKPEPSPASFVRAPGALSPTAVAMMAQTGKSELGTVEYRFTPAKAEAGANDSGWVPVPWFLDDGLKPDTRYAYSVAMRDALGNVSASSRLLEVVTASDSFTTFTDRFEKTVDFLASCEGTGWDGVLSQADNSAPEKIASGGGTVRLQSKGTVWDGGKPVGAFLFKNVSGDFVAQVKVADYYDLANRRTTGNNDGGLMIRVPKVQDAGPGEDLVQLNFFPIWNQGNMVTSLDSGSRPQRGNGLGWDAHKHLQIIRQGPLFYFRTSADGVQWRDLPGSPVERQDMDGQTLQVGLYHASYGGESSFVTFTDFNLLMRK